MKHWQAAWISGLSLVLAPWASAQTFSPRASTSNPSARLGRPSASLDIPRVSTTPTTQEANAPASISAPDITLPLGTNLPPIARGAAPDPLLGDTPSGRAATLGPVRPTNGGTIGLGPPEAPPAEQYNWGSPPSDRRRGRLLDRDPDRGLFNFRDREDDVPERPGFGKQLGNWIEERHRQGRFESDHAFDPLISPITNPFYAEDPRSLTEIRPIFMYQTIPNSNYYYRGGDTQFFGLQARLAFSERFSVVVNKLGGQVFNPGKDSSLPSETGFTEFHIGPKFTFLRNENTHAVGAAGLTFQLPIGSSRVYQDTGGLSLVPYFSFMRPMWQTSLGTINLYNNIGYSLSTDRDRSNFLYDTLHFDLDLDDRHRFYPVMEISWFHYTSNGQSRPLGFEGRDIANIGSAVSGRDFLSIAPGIRFKYSDAFQFGIATEFPLLGQRDLLNFRLGVDLIWRY